MFKKIYPLFFIFLLLFSASAHAGFFGDVGGSLFGGIGSFFGNGIDSVVSVATTAVTSFITGIPAASLNALSSAVTSVGNFITGKSSPVFAPPDKGSQLTNFDPLDEYDPLTYIGDPVDEVHITSKKKPVRISEVAVTEFEFSEIHIANIRVESLLPENELIGGVYAMIFTQLVNVGMADGATKFKITMSCDIANAFSGGETIKDIYSSGWVETKTIKSGRTEEFVLMRWLPEEKFRYGAECEITSQIQENITATDPFQDFAGWVGEGVASFWNFLTGSTETAITTGQTKTIAKIHKTILPRHSQLDAGLDILVIG